MKGYNVDCGYMGYISDDSTLSGGRYMLFACESDYIEYVKETIDNESERTGM